MFPKAPPAACDNTTGMAPDGLKRSVYSAASTVGVASMKPPDWRFHSEA
jgi:hypothetical protein